MWPFLKPTIRPEAMGKILFEMTVDDRLYSNAMRFLGSIQEPIFRAIQRDPTIYAVLMPEISSYKRDDLIILRIELMHFALAYIDYLLMRSVRLHQRFGPSPCFETVRWYLWEFKKRIEPLGRSEEFLSASEIRARAYNEAWDQMLADGEKRNRLLIEETLLRFCQPETPVTNPLIYVALKRDFLSTQTMFSKLLDTYRLRS
jgi:hypothetical protein